jgi:Zn-dependent peptidase ImmA (M78 family)
MNRWMYYEQVRKLALTKRVEHKVKTPLLNLRFMRGIYRMEGIRIDKWETQGYKIRAAYFCEDDDFSILLNKNLPREPMLFSLGHELKHHYLDRGKIQGGQIRCGDYNANEEIEIAAEIFAAEFIYPEAEMRELVDQMDITDGNCTPEKVVEFKRACPALVSYSFIVKRFERFGLCEKGEYTNIRFQKLEEDLHGLPIYKQPWFKRYRARKKARTRA